MTWSLLFIIHHPSVICRHLLCFIGFRCNLVDWGGYSLHALVIEGGQVEVLVSAEAKYKGRGEGGSCFHLHLQSHTILLESRYCTHTAKHSLVTATPASFHRHLISSTSLYPLAHRDHGDPDDRHRSDSIVSRSHPCSRSGSSTSTATASGSIFHIAGPPHTN